MQDTAHGRRIEGLDLLRALAVFLVLAHHAAYRFPPLTDDPLARVLKYAGWIGVDIFFVISGFMITTVLVRDIHRQDIRGFFIRRAFRILPLLFGAVAVFALLALVTGKEVDKLSLLWSPALLLNGWTIPFFGAEQVPYTITWSLSVEETAYALLGLSALWGLKGIRLALFGLLVGTVALRVLAVLTGAIDFYDLYFFVPARLDGIALGGLAVLGGFERLGRWQSLIYIGGLATIGLVWAFQFVRVQHPFMPLAGYLVFGLTCSVWVAAIAQQPPASGGDSIASRLRRPLISFGQLSYFVYLFHLFVLEGLRFSQAKGWVPPLGFWAAVAVTCLSTHGLAWLSWRVFESPLIDQGRRLANAVGQRRRALADL